MNYTYLFENKANNNLQIQDIINNENINILYILCYHINNEIKYPFMQFMLDKVPFCFGITKEQFILPYVFYNNNSETIQDLVINKIKIALDSICCNSENLNGSMYKGIIVDKSEKYYALINISDIDISGLHLSRNNESWFCLPSEIINQGKVCNIEIEEEIVELFSEHPEMSLLTNNLTNEYFILPDVVYSGGEKKNVEFNAIFGKSKSKEYKNSGKYHYFYRSFNEVVKEGGWVKEGGNKLIDKENKEITHNKSGRIIVENEYGRFINGGINRYALFIEGKIYIETEEELSLNDDTIKGLYNDPCLIIGYLENRNKQNKPNIQVKDFESFYPLSCHGLNKQLLGESYEEFNNNIYMIQ